MGASCNIFCRKRNRQTGKLTNKVSLLHKDLLAINEFNENFIRSKANHALFLSQYPKFLELNEDNLIFDSVDLDAEPKLASFYEVALEHMPEVKYEDIRLLLAKKFKEGNYTYEQAYEKIVKFNSEMEGAHSFIATMKPSNDGKWECTIVRNTVLNQEELITNLKNKIFYEKIIEKLNSMGVKVSEGLLSEYNTKNPKAFLDGLVGLITIAKGKQYSEHLAKEAGHFIIGALGENHPLYKRLLSLVLNNEEVVSAILGSDEWLKLNYSEDSNATREFLGHIVGKYLYQVFEEAQTKKTAFQSIKNIIDRIVKWCKARFNIRHLVVANQIYDAELTARKIARNFLGDNFDGSLLEAMKQKEVLHAETNNAFTAIKNNIQAIVLSIERCKALSSKTVLQNKKAALGELLKSFAELKGDIKNIQQQEEVSIFDLQLLLEDKASMLIDVLLHCSEQFIDCMTVLKPAIMGESEDGETLTPLERAKAIRYNETTLRMIQLIIDNTRDVLGEFDSLSDWGIALNNAFTELNKVINLNFANPLNEGENQEKNETWETLIDKGRRVLACNLLTEVNGSPFVYLEAYATTENQSTKNGWLTRAFGKRAFIKHEENVVSINNILNNADMFPRAGWVSRYIASISEHPDRLLSLVYDTVARLKHTSMKRTLLMQQLLHLLYADLKRIGHSNTDFLFELDENGKFTGNLISELDWGRWERDLLKALKEFREAFYEKYKKVYPDKREAFKSFEYLLAYADMIKKFHFQHSEQKTMLDENGKPILDENDEEVKYSRPKADLYHSEQYDRLSDSEKEWLEKYMKLKRQLDRLLPFGCTNPEGVRAPLFPGTLTNNISNAMKAKGLRNKGGALIYNTLSSSLFYFFSKENPDNVLFGGDRNTSNENIEDKDEEGNLGIVNENQEIYDSNLRNAVTEVENLPVYGVRRSPNSLASLSTDLMYSTLAYAAMSNNYDCLNLVVDQLEMVKGLTLTTRKETGSIENPRVRREDLSTYKTMRDFMTFNVYGNYHPTNDNSDLYKTTKKVSNILARFGSFMYLGFNFASSVFNTNTGVVEILKESCRNTLMLGSGSDGRMTLKSALKAHIIFFKHASIALLDNIMKAGGLKKSAGSNIQSGDKMMAFLRAMDSSNENERKFREDRVQTKGWTSFQGFSISNIALLSYSTADRYLLGISYIASALNTPVLDTQTGKITNLYDAYKVVNGVATIDLDRYKVYDKLNARILRYLLAKDAENSEKGIINGLDEEEQRYINNANKEMAELKGIDVEDLDNLSEEEIQELEKQIHWVNINDNWESLFRTKCRKENNRMHGVYNKQDTGNGLNRIAVGGAVMSMKKYLLGIWSRLYASSRYDSSTGDMYQGVLNTLVDLFMMEVGHNYLRKKDGTLDKTVDKYYDKNACLSAVVFIKGLLKFAAVASTGGLLSRKHLKSEGFSLTLLGNLAILLFTLIAIKLFRMGCYWLLPPDDDDSAEEWEWSTPISKALLKADLAIKNNLYWHKSTIDNPIMFDELTLNTITKHFSHSIPYSVKGLCFWTLYRLAREQEFANPLTPKPFLIEVKTQTANSITGVQAFVDVLTKGRLITLDVDIDDIQDLDEKEKYFGGKEIYKQGVNHYWTKGGKGLELLSPFKNLRAISDPYHAAANTMYYDAQTLSLGADDSLIKGVNNRNKSFWQSVDYAFRGDDALKKNPPKIESSGITDMDATNELLKRRHLKDILDGKELKEKNPNYDPFYDYFNMFSGKQLKEYLNKKKGSKTYNLVNETIRELEYQENK